jgi:5-methylcytosine-specific restriction endonuclease McrBC regulatory subunit McrC
MYLFPYFLQKALSQGIFKKYRRFEYNDSTVRGAIDVNRHIRENIPFRGTVAYSTREHSYDNEVTELVRHTIEYIKTKEIGAAILNGDSETKGFVSQIIQATPSYNIRNRQRVINQNVRPIRHPYFTEYTELQKICLQILRHESIKYGQEKDKIYGILFDGAWLWEEYLNTFFRGSDLNITHAKNKTRENGIQLYKGGYHNYYPDFYKKVEGNADKSFVLDAKYKRLGNDVGREDLFQMITYMHVLPANRCALIYPLENCKIKCKDPVMSPPIELLGYGGEIIRFGIPVVNWHKGDYSFFCSAQQKIEKETLEQLGKWIEPKKHEHNSCSNI